MSLVNLERCGLLRASEGRSLTGIRKGLRLNMAGVDLHVRQIGTLFFFFLTGSFPFLSGFFFFPLCHQESQRHILCVLWLRSTLHTHRRTVGKNQRLAGSGRGKASTPLTFPILLFVCVCVCVLILSWIFLSIGTACSSRPHVQPVTASPQNAPKEKWVAVDRRSQEGGGGMLYKCSSGITVRLNWIGGC